MVFSNLIFLYLFLPLNILLYYASRNPLWRNITLIAFSIFFYAWGEPVFVFVLLFTVGVNYFCGRVIGRYGGATARARCALALSIGVNLLLLGLFKYAGFVAESVGGLLGMDLAGPSLALPIGISFYTFQAISYVADVYRGQVRAQESYYKLLLYISLYPQLVAGPIVRYSDVAAQIESRRANSRDIAQGLTRMLCGLTKKVLVANTAGRLLAPYAGADPASLSVAGAWFGMILFTIQIYYDFSGYSDMAIGLGRIFGFKYLENFNYPYVSRSVTEFWRRWHISLSSFFRDYLYIPLGGNRSHVWRNLFVVWLLTGLWHGASWNFVLWGLYYGAFIALERLLLSRALARVPHIVSHLYLLVTTVLGWTLFYFTDLSALGSYLGVMFGFGGAPLWDSGLGIALSNNVFWLMGAMLFCLPVVPFFKRLIARRCTQEQITLVRAGEAAMDIGLLALCTCLLAGQSYNPFLYFRF